MTKGPATEIIERRNRLRGWLFILTGIALLAFGLMGLRG